MAITFRLPNYQRNAMLLSSKQAVRSRVSIMCLASCFHQTAALGLKLHSKSSFLHVDQPYLVKNIKRMTWSIRSNVDSQGLDPSSTNGPNGRTRLIREIRAIQTRVGARIQEIRKDLPLKLFFFLVGFYCATAFATVIGQTGDWDILSAGFAVVVVEAIGALMYRASLPLVSHIRTLITMFNYWKTGLSLGLFLDSFKYGMDDIFGSTKPGEVIGKHRSGPDCTCGSNITSSKPKPYKENEDHIVHGLRQ